MHFAEIVPVAQLVAGLPVAVKSPKAILLELILHAEESITVGLKIMDTISAWAVWVIALNAQRMRV